ncbi:MAG TPA: SpoIIE family protein phosphatase [Planctomycetota bacterium]|nr:SpoIIE family protein phosphatase [Planctomycetota bacterium]
MIDQRARILVVDDDPGMRRAMERILAPLYDVASADGVSQALDRLSQDGRFDVALVDIRLGDGDGYSLCEELRRRSPATDVILITGSISQPDEKLYRSLEGDAFYFLFKPFERRVLRALVERCLRLQRERHAKEEFAGTLARDLARARRFQRSLQPREPVEAAGFRAVGRFEPCDAVGGDFWLALAERDGSLVIAVADVVGHGVSAAMYAGMLRSTLEAARRADPDPASVQEALLSGIDFFEASRYATLFYGQLSDSGRLRFFNAGHPPALLERAGGGFVRLGATGTPLSVVFRQTPRTVQEVSLESGDRLLLFSDGACEARDPGEAELGVDGLERALASARAEDLGSALDGLRRLVFDHVAGRPLEDDVTLVLAERGA